MGEFESSEAWRYWKTEQLPRLVESKRRARRFEEALAQVEAAWTAKDHAAALAALATFRESRDIWGSALLAWVEQEDTGKVWGALPLRPEPEAAPERPTPDREAPQARGSGTGFFVTPTLILTNAHVVQTATTVAIQMEGKPAAQGAVLGKDVLLDLALIEVSGLEGRPLGFCRESLAVGESVYLYGYGAMVTGSGGLTNEQAVWTAGTLSKFQQEGAQRLIVFDATVNPGNSGGPLVDCGGNWIGVVVAKTRSIGAAAIDGYGFAVHGEAAVRWVDEQLAERKVRVTHTKAPEQPLRPSLIARRLPASVVRVVVGGE